MDDKINRQLTAPITDDDSSVSLADELVHYGFISKVRGFAIYFARLKKYSSKKDTVQSTIVNRSYFY